MRVAGRAGSGRHCPGSLQAAGAPGAPGGGRDGDARAGGAAGLAVRGGRAAPGPCRRRRRSAPGSVRLADWVTGTRRRRRRCRCSSRGPRRASKHLVPASQTRGLKHVTGHAPGKGKGQLPPWAAHGPGGVGVRDVHGPAAGAGVQPGHEHARSRRATTAQSDLYKNADGSYTRKVWSVPVNYQTASGIWAPIDETLVPGSAGRWQEKANSVGGELRRRGQRHVAGARWQRRRRRSRCRSRWPGRRTWPAAASGSSVTYPGILPRHGRDRDGDRGRDQRVADPELGGGRARRGCSR